MGRLNCTHTFLRFLNLQAKFFKFTFCLLAKFPANYTNSVQFTQKKMRIMQNSHRLSTIHYTFRCLTISRELSEIPVNQVKFVPFAHKYAKFATFANNRQDKLCTSYTYCTYFTTCISHVCTHLAPL